MWRLSSSLLLLLVVASSGSAVTIDWTPIGDPGNACEAQQFGCFGGVGYAYSVGTYEVTNAQYAEFLNAKAASDPLALYNPAMGVADPVQYGGITRAGSDGNYTYSVIAGRGDMPVNHVSLWDAVRFANWMNNGQGAGDTETGAYTLLGGTASPSNGDTVTRNPGAIIVLTSENEWYKAAYYDSSTASYFDYPAGFDAPTTCSAPTATPNSANCHPGGPADLTAVGSYTGSASPYGTYDQGGNVSEWNEAIIITEDFPRVRRGGQFAGGDPTMLAADFRSSNAPEAESLNLGFRLAMIPEPSTGLLVIAGLVGLALRRKIRH